MIVKERVKEVVDAWSALSPEERILFSMAIEYVGAAEQAQSKRGLGRPLGARNRRKVSPANGAADG